MSNKSCCRLGAELDYGKNVLYKTRNFFVVPALGQMGIEGYVLVCSNEHHIGIGGMPDQLNPELEDIVEITRNKIKDNYGPNVVVFEHGPKMACKRSGACLDHAHLHVVPTSVDILQALSTDFKPEETNGFGRLKDLYDSDKPYLFLETQSRERYLFEVTIQVPSQYLRQIIAEEIGTKKWDWRTNKDLKTFEKTMSNLKDKF